MNIRNWSYLGLSVQNRDGSFLTVPCTGHKVNVNTVGGDINMGLELKMRLLKLGMKQIDMLVILRKKKEENPDAFQKVILEPSYISRALRGEPGERFDRLREVIDQTLAEKEAQRAAQNTINEMQMRPFL